MNNNDCPEKKPLTEEYLKKMDAYWRAANYLAAAQLKKFDLDLILLSGPGHGGNFFVANSYLEGTYSEVYPNVSEDEEGMTRLCKQFSFPGGISSHVAPETPGSINEGGELGYSLAHAFGAVFDNPGLIAATIVGDGEAETGPLATAWHSNKFLNPVTDGAVLKSAASSTAAAGSLTSSRATSPCPCTGRWRKRSTSASRRSRRSRERPAKRAIPSVLYGP